jgi:hypothetical protein
MGGLVALRGSYIHISCLVQPNKCTDHFYCGCVSDVTMVQVKPQLAAQLSQRSEEVLPIMELVGCGVNGSVCCGCVEVGKHTAWVWAVRV